MVYVAKAIYGKAILIKCYDFVGYLEIDEEFFMVARSNDSFMVFV